MNMPKISVMMPARNTGKYIKDSINSILAQEFFNWELIIIDDKSTDDTRVIAEHFAEKDSRIKVYEGNGIGIANARNKIIDLSTGKYIMLLDSDDVSKHTRMKLLVETAEKYEQSYVGSNLNFVSPDLSIINSSDKPLTNKEIRAGFKRIINRETIVPGTVLANREIFEKYRYNESYKIMSDWDLTLRVSEDKNVVFSNIKDTLYNYRLNNGSMTLNKSERIKYNLFIRTNEMNRHNNRSEIKSINEFESIINNSLKLKLVYTFLVFIKKIQHNLNFKKYSAGL